MISAVLQTLRNGLNEGATIAATGLHNLSHFAAQIGSSVGDSIQSGLNSVQKGSEAIMDALQKIQIGFNNPGLSSIFLGTGAANAGPPLQVLAGGSDIPCTTHTLPIGAISGLARASLETDCRLELPTASISIAQSGIGCPEGGYHAEGEDSRIPGQTEPFDTDGQWAHQITLEGETRFERGQSPPSHDYEILVTGAGGDPYRLCHSYDGIQLTGSWHDELPIGHRFASAKAFCISKQLPGGQLADTHRGSHFHPIGSIKFNSIGL